MDIKNIYYIAGLLEGEGYFGHVNTPTISLKMTDEDTVVNARNMMSPNSKIRIVVADKSRKTVFVFGISGNLAIQWMMTIYSLMSRRRKERFREVIQKWHKHEHRDKGVDVCKNGHGLLIEGIDFTFTTNKSGSKYKSCRNCQKEYKEIKSVELAKVRKEYKGNRPIRTLAKIKNISIEEATILWNKTINRVN